MDARRDMFFVGDRENIELIYKDKIEEKIKDKSLLVDKNCAKIFENATCFELEDIDLSKTMIELAIKKYENTEDKNEFNYLKAEANYIQTPPIF